VKKSRPLFKYLNFDHQMSQREWQFWHSSVNIFQRDLFHSTKLNFETFIKIKVIGGIKVLARRTDGIPRTRKEKLSICCWRGGGERDFCLVFTTDI